MIEVNPKKPITQITEDVIRIMKIHSTVSHLRRYIGDRISVLVDNIPTMPKLLYTLNLDGTKEYWELNILVEDLCKFIMVNMFTKSESPECQENKNDSVIRWDRVTGITEYGEWVEPAIIGRNIYFSGLIKYYPGNDPGNKVGVFIIPSTENIEKYPHVRVIIDGQVYSKEIFFCSDRCTQHDYIPKLHAILSIDKPGDQKSIVINWDDYYQEIFLINVTKDSTLEHITNG
jgi:hypothetical protein